MIVTKSSKRHSALNGRPGHFGQDSESLHDYFGRMKRYYNDELDGLYDELAQATTTILLALSTPEQR